MARKSAKRSAKPKRTKPLAASKNKGAPGAKTASKALKTAHVKAEKAMVAPLADRTVVENPAAGAAKAKSGSKKEGFMWKLLEQKEAAQKQNSGRGASTTNPNSRVRGDSSIAGLGRFVGPRRRIG